MLSNLDMKRVTIVRVSSLAMTQVVRGTCVGHETVFALESILVQPDRKPRQRKVEQFRIPVDKGTLIFEGDLPFKSDVETGGSFFGNACLNFRGDVAVVSEWVNTRNVNPKFTEHDHVMVVEDDASGFKSFFTPVFPDVPTHSAPVEQYRRAYAAKEALAA